MAARNREQLRTEAYARLAESGSGFYTDAQLNQWLNDGVRDLAINVEPLVTTATQTTVASTAEYALPDDFISVKLAQFLDPSGNWYSLQMDTFQGLLETNPSFETESAGQPSTWYWRQDVIGLYPAPSATYDGANTLRILYSYIPAAMTDDTSTTGLDEWLEDAVILYAVYRAYLKDRDFQRAQATAQEYGRGLAEATIKLNRQTKQHGPRLVPETAPYRGFYQRRPGNLRISST